MSYIPPDKISRNFIRPCRVAPLLSALRTFSPLTGKSTPLGKGVMFGEATKQNDKSEFADQRNTNYQLSTSISAINRDLQVREDAVGDGLHSLIARVMGNTLVIKKAVSPHLGV